MRVLHAFKHVSAIPHVGYLVVLSDSRYHTASEVIREGLRLLEERDRLYQVRLEELRRDVKLGIDQLNRGESVPFDPVAAKRRLRKRVRAKTRRGTK